MQQAVPMLAACVPPTIIGVAALAEAVQAGRAWRLRDDLERRSPATAGEQAARLLDLASLHRLTHEPAAADALEAEALSLSPLFRVGRSGTPANPLRMLAIMAPGDLMVNTPLDFITGRLPVQLDLLYVQPGRTLPACVPEHDVAFFAVSESDTESLARLAPLFAVWPRPALNDPARVARLSRDGLPTLLRGAAGLYCPPARAAGRTELPSALQETGLPAVIRPRGSHAGRDLARLDQPAALTTYLSEVSDQEFFISPFVDYAGRDGLYRKLRLAMIGGRPLLCHLAVSSDWIVHYMSAGMADNAARRDEEAAAMRDFDAGFAQRHRAALDAIAARVGLDYFQLDCAELPDGRLLVFEADVAAIIHMLDPPALFPYKPAQMRRVFAAFGDLLSGAGRPQPSG